MSVNFHAYQCRDYLLSDYEEIEKQWKASFSGYNPERVMHILNLKRDEQYLYVRYFQTLYRLRLKDGTLEKQNTQSENDWTTKVYFNEAMVIYHLLYYVKDHALVTGVWIPNTELDPRAHGNNQREDLLFTSFTRHFCGKPDELNEACRKLNGIELQTKADIAYEFSAFPQINLRLLFWDEDEDFPAQAQILVDKRITDYVHLETTGCMVSDLFEKLIDAFNDNQKQQ